jgi:hypothetical protein
MNWKQKLASRKFWACLTAIAGAVLVFTNLDSASIEKIIALIGAFGTMITYILVEGNIDAEAVKK